MQVDTCKLAFGDDLTLLGSQLTYDTGTHELKDLAGTQPALA
jgi:hypothetical protein